ncbi:hypothetical protein BDW62DRAFT_189562 [Aspergillus aurantiobrunneus]
MLPSPFKSHNARLRNSAQVCCAVRERCLHWVKSQQTRGRVRSGISKVKQAKRRLSPKFYPLATFDFASRVPRGGIVDKRTALSHETRQVLPELVVRAKAKGNRGVWGWIWGSPDLQVVESPRHTAQRTRFKRG